MDNVNIKYRIQVWNDYTSWLDIKKVFNTQYEADRYGLWTTKEYRIIKIVDGKKIILG